MDNAGRPNIIYYDFLSSNLNIILLEYRIFSSLSTLERMLVLVDIMKNVTIPCKHSILPFYEEKYTSADGMENEKLKKVNTPDENEQRCG